MTPEIKLGERPNNGPDFQRWKDMVESVIDFIAASRTMLNVLTDKLEEGKRFREEEKRKIEDEKVKLEFYKECLKMELNNVVKKVNNDTSTDLFEAGDQRCHYVGFKSAPKYPQNTKEKLGSGILKTSKYLSKIPRQQSNTDQGSKSRLTERSSETSNVARSCLNRRTRSKNYVELSQKLKTT
ncbi:uncharacterized protein LOC115889926 [Sitophilus oryzae]|uniref:Uncharacterized protein LOC115889926 n=1 Tax=Sitophilus oryzae TaxID=7048 RepID=A0A6J2YRF1_SITOR|nr:uncharacterized protein LOC115889926 [Sitophilus oryzae]